MNYGNEVLRPSVVAPASSTRFALAGDRGIRVNRPGARYPFPRERKVALHLSEKWPWTEHFTARFAAAWGQPHAKTT